MVSLHNTARAMECETATTPWNEVGTLEPQATQGQPGRQDLPERPHAPAALLLAPMTAAAVAAAAAGLHDRDLQSRRGALPRAEQRPGLLVRVIAAHGPALLMRQGCCALPLSAVALPQAERRQRPSAASLRLS